MTIVRHREWAIQPRSVQRADSKKWSPRDDMLNEGAGAMQFKHDLQTEKTFDTQKEADAYAVKMASDWIDTQPPR